MSTDLVQRYQFCSFSMEIFDYFQLKQLEPKARAKVGNFVMQITCVTNLFPSLAALSYNKLMQQISKTFCHFPVL